MRFILISLIVIGGLVACNDNSDEAPSDAAPMPDLDEQRTYEIHVEVLPASEGFWQLVPDSAQVEEREVGFVLNAQYTHISKDIQAGLQLTVFRDIADAPRTLDERVANWRSDDSNTVSAISSLADGAYVLNESQTAIALVGGDSLAEATLIDAAAATDIDLLNLLQIGIDGLIQRVVPPERSGSLGNATLAPQQDSTP